MQFAAVAACCEIQDGQHTRRQALNHLSAIAPSILPSAAMELQVDTLIRATSDHLAAHLEGGSFVLELGSGTYYRLNEVAGRAWQLLREPTTITTMSKQISQEYDVDEVTCVADLLALGRQLADEGLITTVDG